MREPERRFLWTVHQVAVGPWLKRELAERAPELRFAFARPGLTTFKWMGGEPLPIDGGLKSSFARAWGVSFGRIASHDELLAHADAVSHEPLRLHVFERDSPRPIEQQSHRGERARAIEASLRERWLSRFVPGSVAGDGERVLDVIVPPVDEPEEPWLIGWHVHGPDHGREPGGVAHAIPPAEAPSRAWSKIEEALRWSGLSPRAGETAVEIGAAPGGACWALLDRGLRVIAIDPGPMDPRVLARPALVHVKQPFGEVERRELPARFEWLLVDVNLAPTHALRYVERALGWTRRLRGAVLTLKLNDDAVARDLPRWIERLQKLVGPGARVRVTQLPSHRSEVAAIVEWT